MARYDTDGTSALAPDYSGEDSSSLGEHDTYRQMLDDTQKSIRPNLNPERKNNIIDARSRFGKNPLSSAESTAAKNGSPLGTNASIAEKLPQSASPIKFTGKGAQNGKKSPTNLKGIMKKGGPIAALVGVIAIAGGGMLLGQSSLPFSLMSRVSQEFNGRAAIASVRSNEIMSFSMNPKNTNPVLKNTIFGNGKSIGKHQLSRLNANGIEQIDLDIQTIGGSDKTARPLLFTDADGNTVLAFPDPSNMDLGTAAKISEMFGDIDILDLNDALASNTTFRHKYTAATLTWRGKIANSFNSGIARTLKRLGLGSNRNRFAKWEWGNAKLDSLDAWSNEQLGIYSERSERRRAKTIELLDQSGADLSPDSASTPVTATIRQEEQQTDSDGNPVIETKIETVDVDNNEVRLQNPDGTQSGDLAPNALPEPTVAQNSDLKADKKVRKTKLANTGLGTVINLAASLAGVGITLQCSVGSFGTQVIAVVAARAAVSGTSAANSFAEVFQRLLGVAENNKDATEIAALYNEALVRPGENGKSPIDGEAAAMLYGSNINQNSEVFAKTNNESSISSLPYKPQTGEQYKNCAGLNIVTGLVTTGISIALNFIPVAGAADDAGKIAKGASKLVTATSVLGSLAQIAAPLILQVALRKVMTNTVERFASSDLASELLIVSNDSSSGKTNLVHAADGNIDDIDIEPPYAREAAGNDLIHYLARQERKLDQVSLPIASRETHAANAQAKKEYLANLAEFERATMSPFDVSSENTFLGSLLYKTMPFHISSSPFGIMPNLLKTVGSSFSALLPSAFAQTETSLAGIGECEILDAVGAIGDKFCEPIYEQDFSTIDIDPSDIFELVATGTDGRPNFEKDGDNYIVEASGNPKVSVNSELMKYIANCTIRDSQPGIADGGVAAVADWFDKIASDETGEGRLDQNIKTGINTVIDVGNGIAGIVGGPVGGAIGMVIDVGRLISNTANEGIKIANAGYVSAEYCVASSSNPKWNEKFKYYAQYLNDQEQFESAGMIDESARTVALDAYYKINPLDTSYEGLLARHSGLTKDEVIATLEYMDYMDFVASYNPSDRLPIEKLILPTINDLIPDTEIASHSTKIGNPLATFVYSPTFLPLRDRTTTTA